jgi:hypothetical protein
LPAKTHRRRQNHLQSPSSHLPPPPVSQVNLQPKLVPNAAQRTAAARCTTHPHSRSQRIARPFCPSSPIYSIIDYLLLLLSIKHIMSNLSKNN